MNKLSSNLDLGALKNSIEQKYNTYMPQATSQLVKHKPTFYTDVLGHIITHVPNKQHVDLLKVNFDVALPVTPQTLCMINIAEYQKLHGDFDGFSKAAGFDMQYLPDNIYMLRLIATTNKKELLIGNLPSQGIALDQEWKNIVCQNVLDNILKTGKVQKGHAIDCSSIEDYILEMTDAGKAYFLLKFKMSEMKKRLLAINKLSTTNSLVRSMVQQYKPGSMLADVEKRLEITEKETRPQQNTQNTQNKMVIECIK